MLSARERLRRWIAKEKLTQREAAMLLQIDESYLSQLLGDKRLTRRPSLAKAVLIEDVTGIPARAWMAIGDDDFGLDDSANPDKVKIGRG